MKQCYRLIFKENESSLRADLQSLKGTLDKPLKGEAYTFRLTQYDQKLNDSKTFYSPSFYSNGYHMSVEVLPKGINSSDSMYVSVYVNMLEDKDS